MLITFLKRGPILIGHFWGGHIGSFFSLFRDDICFDLWEYHGVHVDHYCYSDHSIGVLH